MCVVVFQVHSELCRPFLYRELDQMNATWQYLILEAFYLKEENEDTQSWATVLCSNKGKFIVDFYMYDPQSR